MNDNVSLNSFESWCLKFVFLFRRTLLYDSENLTNELFHYIQMSFVVSTLLQIRHLWELKIVIFLHRCLIAQFYCRLWGHILNSSLAARKVEPSDRLFRAFLHHDRQVWAFPQTDNDPEVCTYWQTYLAIPTDRQTKPGVPTGRQTFFLDWSSNMGVLTDGQTKLPRCSLWQAN